MGLDLTKVAIGFTGTGGTGKTTTAKALAKELGLTFQPSVSRSVFERHGITEADQRNMTAEENLKLQLEIFEARRWQLREKPFGVYDRTLLDQLVYTLYRGGPAVSEVLYRNLCEDVLSDLTRHVVVFYCPMTTFAGSADGFREDGFGYRLTIDLMNQAMQKLIANEDTIITLLPVMSVQERVSRIKKHLEVF